MGATFSSMFGATDELEPSDEHLQLSDLGGFLSKYIFIMLDKDKTKLVSKQEYLTLVNHFREQKTSEEELDAFLQKHMPEGQSAEFIDESLFKKLIVQLAVDFDRNIEDRMRYLMTLFDKDDDGFVNETDLCNVYDTIGIQVPMEPIKCLISKFDVDGDGKLSVQEFEQLGRSAMSKLFIRKEETAEGAAAPVRCDRSLEDMLVAEAIERASHLGLGVATSQSIPKLVKREQSEARGFGDSVDPDILNNNLVKDAPSASAFRVGDEVLIGKPLELKKSDYASSVADEGAAHPYPQNPTKLDYESVQGAGNDADVGETVVDNLNQ